MSTPLGGRRPPAITRLKPLIHCQANKHLLIAVRYLFRHCSLLISSIYNMFTSVRFEWLFLERYTWDRLPHINIVDIQRFTLLHLYCERQRRGIPCLETYSLNAVTWAFSRQG